MNKLTPVLILLVALTGCQESREETAEDVAEARADGAENVREAQDDLADANKGTDPTLPAGMTTMPDPEDAADERYDVAVAKAKAALDVEQEKCEAQTGDARDTCKDAAKAVYDKAVADAELVRTQNQQVDDRQAPPAATNPPQN